MAANPHEHYMRQALFLAAKGAGRVAPNPMVGAVIVKNGKIIGKGYHRNFGGPHAEVEAIHHCREHNHDPTDAAMYVTLEPCCHHGKTGPCTEAIYQAGIKEVLIATLDDCNLVAGKGVQWLKDHNIKIDIGCCQAEARRLNAGFFKAQKTGHPLVILKWAQSLDGKLAWPKDSDHRWITGDRARRHVHEIRRQCGAVMIGVGTLLADNPMLNVRLEGDHPQPLRIVLDSHLQTPTDCNLVKTAHDHPVLIYTMQSGLEEQPEKAELFVESGCQVITAGYDQDHVHIPMVLSDLGRRGVTELLVEGGSILLRAFWQAELADKIMTYIAPVIIGNDNDVPAINFDHTIPDFVDCSYQQFDKDMLIEGILHTF